MYNNLGIFKRMKKVSLESLKLFYEIISKILENIGKVKTEKEFYKLIGKVFKNSDIFEALWFGSPDENGIFKIDASFGRGAKALKKFKIGIHSSKKPLAARAWIYKKIFYNNDHLKDKNMEPYLEFLTKNRWCSGIAIPIFLEKEGEKRLYKILSLVSSHKNIFNKDILEVITKLQKIIGLILTKIKYRELIFDADQRDQLTGFLNFKGFLKALSSKKYNSIIVLILNIDNFSKINKLYSKDFGDKVLIKVANILNDLFKDIYGDLIVLGREENKDEFLVAIRNIDLSENYLKTIGFNIFSLIEKTFLDPITVEGKALNISFSAGFDIFLGKNSIEKHVRNAIFALYKAKALAKKVVYYKDLAESVIEKDLYLFIKNSLEQNENLIILYQPKFDFSKNKIFGFEALIRLKKEDDIFSPDKFLPTMEQTNLIKDLDFYIIDKAFEFLSSYKESDFILNVNINTSHLSDDKFIEFLEERSSSYKDLVDRLYLEVTETSFLNEEFAEKLSKKIKSFGYNLSLDDFGKGYSSFSWFRSFEVDEVKIDIEFVQNLFKSYKNMLTVRTIIDICKIFQRDVISEGVENLEQLVFLSVLGCNKFQGFFIGRPMPIDEALNFYKSFKLSDDIYVLRDIRLRVEDFPILRAYLSHKRFLETIPAKLTENELLILQDHTKCEFGKWLYKEGMKSYGHIGIMKEIELIHKTFHESIGIKPKNELENISNKLSNALLKLIKHIFYSNIISISI